MYACEMAPLAETDRSILFLNFSHAHGRQLGSVNRRLFSNVGFASTDTYVYTSIKYRCDPAMPLAGHSI